MEIKIVKNNEFTKKLALDKWIKYDYFSCLAHHTPVKTEREFYPVDENKDADYILCVFDYRGNEIQKKDVVKGLVENEVDTYEEVKLIARIGLTQEMCQSVFDKYGGDEQCDFGNLSPKSSATIIGKLLDDTEIIDYILYYGLRKT